MGHHARRTSAQVDRRRNTRGLLSETLVDAYVERPVNSNGEIGTGISELYDRSTDDTNKGDRARAVPYAWSAVSFQRDLAFRRGIQLDKKTKVFGRTGMRCIDA